MSLRGAVDDLLHRPQADRNLQDRVTKVLNQTPRRPLYPRHLAYQCTQTGPITTSMRSWNLSAQPIATAQTGRLIQDEMGHIDLNRGQLEHLMRVVRRWS